MPINKKKKKKKSITFKKMCYTKEIKEKVMKSVSLFVALTVLVVIAQLGPNARPTATSLGILDLGEGYKPVWSDLDTRPLPEWYDRAKIGIFLHWGVYSVPGFYSEWFWKHWKDGNPDIRQFMEKCYPPNFSYKQFAPMFTAEFFEPYDWAQLFKKAGAKYIVLTSKHHDGYALFPSNRSVGWNSVCVGPHKDLVGELSKAVRDAGLQFGVYYSMLEWYNPLYLVDAKRGYTSYNYVIKKFFPDLVQLVNEYKPSVIWSDGNWEGYDQYWNSAYFLTWLYNKSPVKDYVVVNDRWGADSYCKHGDFYNCKDRYNPGNLQPHKWENAFNIDKESWGYRRNINLVELLTPEEIIKTIVNVISCGGNVLMNVGPTKEGTIAPIFQEILLQIGEWLTVNGEAIYGSSPWLFQNDAINRDVWYTCKKTTYNARRPTAVPDKTDTVTVIYAIFLNWPEDNVVKLARIAPELNQTINHIALLGFENHWLKWSIIDKEMHVTLPNKSGKFISNLKFAWTLKLTK